MKKLYTAALALLSIASFGQATRLVLVEEYTGENCGPCASTNPAFDALVQANTSKTVMLKHQVPIPSAGPIYQGWTTDSDARRSYYGVNSAPNGRIDGDVIDASQSSPTHPYYLTQSIIDNRASVASSFSMNTSHTVSADLDSIYITVTVQNVDGFTVNSQSAGSLRLHVSVIEEEMQFATPPGTNGEKEFYHVNRKMFPNAGGTAMADAWAVNQSQTFTFAEPLPSHIYDYREVAVVAYIQDNGNKEVMQASFSPAGTLVTTSPNAALNNTTPAQTDLCNKDFTPSFEIVNTGTVDITSADVRYRVNSGAWTTQNWTGTLAAGQTAAVAFPQVTLSNSSNTVEAEVTNVNGGAIEISQLDNAIDPFSVNFMSSTVYASPYNMDFESVSAGNLPPNSILDGHTGYNTVVTAAFVGGSYPLGAFGASDKAMIFAMYPGYLPAGTVSTFTLPKVDISSMGTNAMLYFSRAYSAQPGSSDNFEIELSDDCGATWTSVWSASGTSLSSDPNTPTTSGQFWPSSPSNWKMEGVEVPSSMQGASELIIRMTASANGGNNLFIDNVWVSRYYLGEEENSALNELSVFPNPASDVAELSFDAPEAGAVEVTVLDMNGRAVNTINETVSAGAQSIALDVTELPAGIYMVKVQQNETVKTLRLSVTH